MDNKRTAAIKRIKKIWLMTALVMALGITLYFLQPDWQRIKEFTFWGDLGFTFLLISDGLFLVGFPIIWLLLRNKFSPPLKHWELNAFVQWVNPPKELGGKDICDLLPPEFFPAKYENEIQRKARLKQDKRLFASIPLVMSSLCVIAVGVTLSKHGLSGLSALFWAKEKTFFVLFLSSLLLFPASYALVWLGNNYLEPGAKKVSFAEIDPVVRLLTQVIRFLKRRTR